MQCQALKRVSADFFQRLRAPIIEVVDVAGLDLDIDFPTALDRARSGHYLPDLVKLMRPVFVVYRERSTATTVIVFNH